MKLEFISSLSSTNTLQLCNTRQVQKDDRLCSSIFVITAACRLLAALVVVGSTWWLGGGCVYTTVQ